ncbi:MAG: transcriptional regulator [Chloroflexi bacterium]|nr:transcriptional regulator [Chloroflexota bacterium]
MSKVVSLRLKDSQIDSLNRAARRLGRTPSEAASLLLDEALRQRDFAFIEFRDSPVGRQAYLQGTRLAIWQIVSIARDYGGDVAKIATHLSRPPVQIAAALHYATTYPEEIEAGIADNECSVANLERLIPNLKVVKTDAPSP